MAWNSKGICWHSLGDLTEASACYEHAVELGRSIGFRRIEVIGLYNLGLIYVDQANLDKADQYDRVSFHQPPDRQPPG